MCGGDDGASQAEGRSARRRADMQERRRRTGQCRGRARTCDVETAGTIAVEMELRCCPGREAAAAVTQAIFRRETRGARLSQQC